MWSAACLHASRKVGKNAYLQTTLGYKTSDSGTVGQSTVAGARLTFLFVSVFANLVISKIVPELKAA